jgi:hypothetical protein
MSLPKLENEEDFFEEANIMYQEFMWFLEVSGDFFDAMYGNIYEDEE